MNGVIIASALVAISFGQGKNLEKYSVEVKKGIAYGKDELQKLDAYLPKTFEGG